MKFLNRNHHYIYLELPGVKDNDLTRIKSFETIDLTGADADVAAATPGVVKLDDLTDEERAEIDAELNERKLALGSDGEVGPAADVSTAGDGDALGDKNVKQLRELAKAADISGFSKLKKAELVKALEKHYADQGGGSAGPVTTADVPSKGS